MALLPKNFDYDEVFPTIDEDFVTYNSSVVPVNGASFTAGQQIMLDLPQMDAFLVPDSLYIKYKCAVVTGTNTNPANMLGTPVYTPFIRQDVLVNSQQIDSLLGFNFVANLITNLTMSASQKAGCGAQFGYTHAENNTLDTDGRTLSASTGETFMMSAPLNNILSNCTKSIPLNNAQYRIVLTMDTMANMFGYVASSGALTSITISNMELCYEIMQPSYSIRRALFSRPSTILKTLTIGHASLPITSGSSGTQTLTYNMRYKSIKAVFLTFTPTAVANGTITSNNNGYDSFDCTNGNGAGSAGGDYCILINGVQYPNKTLSVSQNRAGLISELKKASTTLGVEYSKIFDKNNEMSISGREYAYACSETPGTSKEIPGKFVVGIHTEKLHNNQIFFSGVSSKQTTISVRINIPTATTIGLNANLTVIADATLNYDNTNGMVNSVY